ncbi:hypothetical protein CERSUDRAFT_101578 [Gelatoporia subvermispora B]|uniref:Uncharacterized protein n=1 Tax=Ceriporiopsis subvermispora (strain B) TaxID=914234 RepID=M2QUW5_CERS8|nr:hypothetical protein CERSUDRAFT_101578 [Gelatoporia subvermispora B]
MVPGTPRYARSSAVSVLCCDEQAVNDSPFLQDDPWTGGPRRSRARVFAAVTATPLESVSHRARLPPLDSLDSLSPRPRGCVAAIHLTTYPPASTRHRRPRRPPLALSLSPPDLCVRDAPVPPKSQHLEIGEVLVSRLCALPR